MSTQESVPETTPETTPKETTKLKKGFSGGYMVLIMGIFVLTLIALLLIIVTLKNSDCGEKQLKASIALLIISATLTGVLMYLKHTKGNPRFGFLKRFVDADAYQSGKTGKGYYY